MTVLQRIFRRKQPNTIRPRALSDIHDPGDRREIKTVVPPGICLDKHRFVRSHRKNRAEAAPKFIQAHVICTSFRFCSSTAHCGSLMIRTTMGASGVAFALADR